MERWQQQLRESITSLEQLSEVLLYPLHPGAMEVLLKARLLITPQTLSLIDKENPACPIARMCVPHEHELETVGEELKDPIGDEAYLQVPHLVHRYQDRALVQVNYACAQQCRFVFVAKKQDVQQRAREMKILYAWLDICESIQKSKKLF